MPALHTGPESAEPPGTVPPARSSLRGDEGLLSPGSSVNRLLQEKCHGVSAAPRAGHQEVTIAAKPELVALWDGECVYKVAPAVYCKGCKQNEASVSNAEIKVKENDGRI